MKLDINVQNWKIPEARAYRAAVKVNPEYAAAVIDAAIQQSQAEARAEFGEAIDTPGWEPPADWTPMALLNIEPDYLLGFAWITARRDEPGLAFDAFAEGIPYGDLVSGFWTALQELVAEAVTPLAEKSGRPSGNASKSARSTTGRSKTSTASRSKSSASRSTS